MYQKKKIFNMIFALIVLSILLAFLRPRSFLRSIDNEIKSMSVVIIENSLEHEQTEYTFNVNDPEFHEIMNVLDRYPYHISLGTISNRIKDTAHIEDNKAGYWLDIDMYTELDRSGDLYSIISGGTGELIFNGEVYRMGYLGNKTHLNFMSEVCQTVASN